MPKNWVVLKFGGTSVSQVSGWETISRHTNKLLSSDSDLGIWIVVSALSNVTNKLESCVLDNPNFRTYFNQIQQQHVELAKQLGIHDEFVSDPEITLLFNDLHKLLEGIELTGDSSSSRLLARVFGFGEMLSSKFGKLILETCKFNEDDSDKKDGQKVVWVDARKYLKIESGAAGGALSTGMNTADDKYLNGYVAPKIDPTIVDGLKLEENNCRVVITQGFIAGFESASKKLSTCVLGRGGGDVSGALFACLLNARRFEVWTDVNGMYSSDPRHVPGAKLISTLSYREAQELAAMGAKVLHPRCLIPCSFANIPVQVHNTFAYESSIVHFTRIVPKHSSKSFTSPDEKHDFSLHNGKDENLREHVIAIAKRTNQTLVTLKTIEMWNASGFLLRMFEPFHRYGVSVDLIATSQYSVSVTLDYIPGANSGENEIFTDLIQELSKVGTVSVEKKCSVVSIVGRKLKQVLHQMSDAFKCFQKFNVLLVSESSEDLNLSFVVQNPVNSSTDVDMLVKELHKILLEEKFEKVPKFSTVKENGEINKDKANNSIRTSFSGLNLRDLEAAQNTKHPGLDQQRSESKNLDLKEIDTSSSKILVNLELLLQLAMQNDADIFVPVSAYRKPVILRFLRRSSKKLTFLVDSSSDVEVLLSAFENWNSTEKIVMCSFQKIERIMENLPEHYNCSMILESEYISYLQKSVLTSSRVILAKIEQIDTSAKIILLNVCADICNMIPSNVSLTLISSTSASSADDKCEMFDIYVHNINPLEKPILLQHNFPVSKSSDLEPNALVKIENFPFCGVYLRSRKPLPIEII